MARDGDIVDIDGLRQPEADRSHDPARRSRPWLAVHWRCCHTYSRIYRNRDGSAYEGRCPRCGQLVRARIGPDGTCARFFEAR